MFPRNKTSKKGKALPQDWIEGLNRLLNETYKTECRKNARYFDVYGQVFPEEFLLTISYVSEKNEYLSPVTLFLSAGAELISSEELVKETQKNFIDLAGLFFDEIFSEEQWNEFTPNWQQVFHKNQNYFYKITRENIAATLEANRLLGDEFEDNEDLDQ